MRSRLLLLRRLVTAPPMPTLSSTPSNASPAPLSIAGRKSQLALDPVSKIKSSGFDPLTVACRCSFPRTMEIGMTVGADGVAALTRSALDVSEEMRVRQLSFPLRTMMKSYVRRGSTANVIESISEMKVTVFRNALRSTSYTSSAVAGSMAHSCRR